MKRIQFYPSEELDAKLSAEASELGISVSSLVCDKLNQIYFNSKLTDSPTPSFSMIYGKVKEEIETYVKHQLSEPKKYDDKGFTLSEVSETFKNIEMTMSAIGVSKPATLRARIGKTFYQQVSNEEIDNVTRAFTPSGEPMFRYKSAVYRISL